ncbi:MAG: hypothetical protein U1F36_04600 [Planctomycetota bacterium]
MRSRLRLSSFEVALLDACGVHNATELVSLLTSAEELAEMIDAPRLVRDAVRHDPEVLAMAGIGDGFDPPARHPGLGADPYRTPIIGAALLRAAPSGVAGSPSPR